MNTLSLVSLQNYTLTTKLQVNYKRSLNEAVIKHFFKISFEDLHAHFFFYVQELSHTSYVHWRECARNFQFMLKVTSQLCYMQFFLFLISTRFPNTSVISMIQKLNYFSTLILSPPIFSIAAAVMRTAFWPLSLVVKSVFFFQQPL